MFRRHPSHCVVDIGGHTSQKGRNKLMQEYHSRRISRQAHLEPNASFNRANMGKALTPQSFPPYCVMRLEPGDTSSNSTVLATSECTTDCESKFAMLITCLCEMESPADRVSFFSVISPHQTFGLFAERASCGLDVIWQSSRI